MFRPRFDHLLDGLVFGAASGLGFAAAQSIVYSWLLLQGPFLQNGLVVSWVLPVLRIALFVPLLDAATTALICGAIWLIVIVRYLGGAPAGLPHQGWRR